MAKSDSFKNYYNTCVIIDVLYQTGNEEIKYQTTKLSFCSRTFPIDFI